MKHKAQQQSAEIRTITLRWCILLYLCLTGINMIVHSRMIDSQPQFDEKRREIHQQVIENKATAPIQYRILAYYTAEGLQRIGFRFRYSYLAFRGLSIFLAALLFHIFLSKYFPLRYCLLGVTVLLGGMPLTYINYYMQEADALNLFFYLAGFLLIRSREDWYGGGKTGCLFPC